MHSAIRVAAGTILVVFVVGEWAAALPSDHSLWSEPVFRSSYRLVASVDEWAVLDTLPRHRFAPYLKRFWKRRDPTPTTDQNEFRDQFEIRVAYAADVYRAVPPPSPWDARGDMYIKLGPPGGLSPWEPYRGRAPPVSGGVNHAWEPIIINRGPGHLWAPITGILPGNGELWSYFGYMDGQDLRVYFSKDGYSMDLEPSINRNLADTAHVAYTPPFGIEELEMAFDWFPFRRADGHYDVYIACALPLEDLAYRSGRNTGDLYYTGRVRAYDSTLQSVWTDSVLVDMHLEHIGKGMIAQNHWQVVLPPGFYMLAAEIEDPLGDKHAAGSFRRWLVPYADTVQLDLSPLVIAASVRSVENSTSSFVRNNKEIIPMPGHVFKKNQDVAFYHEVYNLRPDSTGAYYYEVEYAVYHDNGKSRRVLFSDHFESRQSQTFQAGNIPHGVLKKRAYILEAKVVDLISGTTRTALSQFKVQ